MITVKQARSVLSYNKRTGIFVWRKTLSNRAPAGTVAGTNSHGYVAIKVLGRIYRAHHLAWLIVKGRWPQPELDHKNRQRSDNRWSNLREATRQKNLGNTPIPRHNTSGVKGVHWHAPRRKWCAGICVNGKTIYLGLFAEKTKAKQVYFAAAKKHFREFARAA